MWLWLCGYIFRFEVFEIEELFLRLYGSFEVLKWF